MSTERKLELRHIVVTSALMAELEEQPDFDMADLQALLFAHSHGNWGDVDDEDKATNERAVKDGSRVLSAYVLHGVRVWVISDAAYPGDEPNVREVTTILRPEDY